MQTKAIWRIGLTGGIGSGKSTVAAMLREHGAEIIDTDAIARRLTQAGSVAMPQLMTAFGADMLDPQGHLDRAKMRARAFADPQAKHTLEQILHPLIRVQAQQQLDASSATVVVLDTPLLVESGHWRERVDQVWVVDCLVETQIQRVTARPGWTREAAQAVITQQATRPQRLACADVVIFNEQLSLTELAQQVDALWEALSAGRISRRL